MGEYGWSNLVRVKSCRCCGRTFTTLFPRQKYCTDPDCVKARREKTNKALSKRRKKARARR